MRWRSGTAATLGAGVVGGLSVTVGWRLATRPAEPSRCARARDAGFEQQPARAEGGSLEDGATGDQRIVRHGIGRRS